MKKIISIFVLILLVLTACNKNKCAECHYDAPAGEVEMGVYCGDSLQNLEELGTYTDSLGNSFVVHCGEH
ncbi:MAG: hypothetical protein ACKOWW_08265 [Flavobacteriales bacterium]